MKVGVIITLLVLLLSGRTAEGIGGVPSGVSTADAAKLARIAWQSVKASNP